MRQECGKPGEEHNDDQGQQCRENQRQGRFADLLHAQAADVGPHIQIDRHGRRDLSHGQVDRHHDAEPDGIPVKVGHDGEHEGQKNVINGDGVQQHACQQQDDVDHQQHNPLVVRQGEQHGRTFFHQAHGGGHPGIKARAGHHNHDHGCGPHAGGKNFEQHVQAVDGAVNEHAHEQAIEHGHSRGLGGREHAAVNAAENDHRRHYAPEGLAQGLAHRLAALFAPVALFARNDQHRAHDEQGHNDAGDKARREQRRYRDIGHAAVDDEGDARRNDDGQTRGHGNRGRGKGFVIARHGHAGDQDQAQRGHRGRAGAAYRSPEGSHGHGSHGQAAGHGAGQGFHQGHNARRDARAFHDIARQDEEGDGQEGKFGDAREKVVGEHAEAHVPLPDDHQGRKAQGKGDGHPEQQGDQKEREQPERGVLKQGCFHDDPL